MNTASRGDDLTCETCLVVGIGCGVCRLPMEDRTFNPLDNDDDRQTLKLLPDTVVAGTHGDINDRIRARAFIEEIQDLRALYMAEMGDGSKFNLLTAMRAAHTAGVAGQVIVTIPRAADGRVEVDWIPERHVPER